MNERTKMARAYLKGITTKADFKALLDKLFITELERKVVESIYLDGKSVEVTASNLGYSPQSIKLAHRRVLFKVSDYLYHKS